MGKRTRAAQAAAAAAAASSATAPTSTVTPQAHSTSLAKHSTAGPSTATGQGKDRSGNSQENGAQGGSAQDAQMAVADDDTASTTSRRKAERKAAKKAAKAALSQSQSQSHSQSAASLPDGLAEFVAAAPAPSTHAGEEDDERARKRARKEARRAEKEKRKAGEEQPMDVDVAADVAVSEASHGKKKKDKKDKKDKKRKDKHAAASAAGDLAVGSSQYDAVPDTALASMLNGSHDISVNAQGDIPVFESYPSTSTQPYDPFPAARYPHDIPVNATSPAFQTGDIPVDPSLLFFPHSHHTPSARAGVAFGPADPTASTSKQQQQGRAVDEHDVAALTARALLMAKDQHEREMAARAAGEEDDDEDEEDEEDEDEDEEDERARRKREKKDKKRQEKGKGKEVDSSASASVSAKSKSKKDKGKGKAAPSVAGDADLQLPTPPAHIVAATATAGGQTKANEYFYEQLVSKWLPVKDLKKLAEEYGATYKQGKFSATEDAVIRSALDAFREQKQITESDLVFLLTAPRASNKQMTLGDGTTGINANEAWETIARALGDRSLLAIYNHVRRLYAPEAKAGKWTDDEDAKLRAAVKELGASAWEEIGRRVGTRTGGACRDRWTKQLNFKGEEGKKGRWTKEEEDELRKWYKELGAQWATISKKMNGTRTPTQCRTKWNDFMVRRDAPPPMAPETRDTCIPFQGEKWRWKTEHSSTLVHAVYNGKFNDETEIDWKTFDHPMLLPHGPKNLRDRFRHLLAGAKATLAKERKWPEAVAKNIPFKDAVDLLRKQNPWAERKPPPRPYAAVEARREAQRLEKYLKTGGKGVNPGGAKSKEVVDSDDDDEEEEESEEEQQPKRKRKQAPPRRTIDGSSLEAAFASVF
ncbi:hypothetical protein JCM10207_003410 [Rhodosporidiobolus poonsookiae]